MVHSELLRLRRLGALARLEAIDREILTLLRLPGASGGRTCATRQGGDASAVVRRGETSNQEGAEAALGGLETRPSTASQVTSPRLAKHRHDWGL